MGYGLEKGKRETLRRGVETSMITIIQVQIYISIISWLSTVGLSLYGWRQWKKQIRFNLVLECLSYCKTFEDLHRFGWSESEDGTIWKDSVFLQSMMNLFREWRFAHTKLYYATNKKISMELYDSVSSFLFQPRDFYNNKSKTFFKEYNDILGKFL
jgi:hypothetical protein